MENLSPQQTTGANRVRNILIAIVAIILSASVFLGLNTQTGSLSLEAQAQDSTPLEIALNNGKPTMTEFYANWCTSCQAMAEDLGKIKQQYQKSVNFVMLNVDNNKWLPEILRYQVDGIPHFVFFNSQGEAIAQSIGEQPKPIIEANLDALIDNQSLPYTYSTGQISEFDAPVKSPQGNQSDPRSHGAQVKTTVE